MILFYAAANDRVVQTLEQQLEPFRVIRCVSFSSVERCLRKPGHGLQVALMIVGDDAEMARIHTLDSLVRDVKLILVLPSHDSAMVASAHKLGPRFIAYMDNGYDQVGAVLEKMLHSGACARGSSHHLCGQGRTEAP